MLVPARSDAAVAARTSRALRVASVSAKTWLLVGIVGIGAWRWFSTLAAPSYWFDEAQAAHRWIWAPVFGTGQTALRSLSALAGVAVIPIWRESRPQINGRAASRLGPKDAAGAVLVHTPS
jgi:hypothetical protein